MKIKMKTSLIFIIGFILNQVLNDIPTHCLSHEILGEWIFYHTDAVPKTLAELYNHKCGIVNHTDKNTINLFNMDINLFKYSFEVRFNKDHTTDLITPSNNITINKKGFWTLVYDEAIEFGMGKKDTKSYSNFLVFLRYSKNDGSLAGVNSKFYSHCYQSLIGWFHTDGNNWGCFYGHKKISNYKQPTGGEAPEKKRVVENKVEPEFLEIKQHKLDSDFEDVSYNNINFIQTKSEMKTNNKDKTLIKLNSRSTNHEAVVERINSMNLSWKAQVYSKMKGKTIEQINKISGQKNKGKHKKYNEKEYEQENEEYENDLENYLFSQSYEYRDNKIIKGKKNVSLSGKNPGYVDYRKFMGTPKSQGECGSCYAMATSTMLESRLRLKYGETLSKYSDDFYVSIDHVLKCSFYNQGCHGGYPYLVGKFYKDFEIMPKQCFIEDSCSNKCKKNQTNFGKLNLKVKDYYYVGGYYGAAREESLVKELIDNGPFVISIAPNYLFSTYKSGILDTNEITWKQLNIEKPEWERVDHSTVLAGFGIENGIEYWIVQNSWGDDWGENGYFRIRKGKNVMNVESIGQCAKIELTEEEI